MKPKKNQISRPLNDHAQQLPDILFHLPAIDTLRPFLVAVSSLRSFETVTIPVTSEVWVPLALSGVIKRLPRRLLERDGIPGDLNLGADGFTTGYLFKTNEGTRGLLAFAGLARNPCRVTLRYKLAGTAIGTLFADARVSPPRRAPINNYQTPARAFSSR